MSKEYRLTKRTYPYVPYTEGLGNGCAIPYPDFSMLSVGYTPVPGCEGNLEIVDPCPNGFPNGGRWEILTTWQTGWMSIRSLISGQVIFSVPPGTLTEIRSQK